MALKKFGIGKILEKTEDLKKLLKKKKEKQKKEKEDEKQRGNSEPSKKV